MNENLKLITSYSRKVEFAEVFAKIQAKIEELFDWHWVNYPEESELIEAVIRNAEAKNVLELGMYTGFTSLHMIRAVYPHGKVVSIDARVMHDVQWFEQPDIARCFEFIHGHTPEIFPALAGRTFDLVFVDSDHSVEHCEKEVFGLWPYTHKGSIFMFHDLPRIQRPDATEDCPLWKWAYSLVERGHFHGVILPSVYRIDCAREFGENYNRDLNPHMGIFIRKN